MPELQVWLPLEDRMERAIARAIAAAMDPQLEEIQEAVGRGDLRRAARVVEQVDLTRDLEKQRGLLELVGLNAVILGASQMIEGKEARLTSFVRGREIPLEVAQAVEHVFMSLRMQGNDRMKATLQQVLTVAEAEDPTIGGVGVDEGLAKFDTWDDLLGDEHSHIAKVAEFIPAVAVQELGLAGALNAAVKQGTKILSTVESNLTTSRLVQFGGLQEAMRGGIKTFQINAVLDGKTCKFCRGVHGKTFKVAPAFNEMQTILGSQDVNVARSLNPWPRQRISDINAYAGMGNSELQEKGFGKPPYHPHCRCTISIVGTVPRGQIKGFEVRPEPVRPVEPQPIVSREAAIDTEHMWRQPSGDWVPERVAAIHDPAVGKLFAGKTPVPAGETPTFQFMGGGSGAGKGTIQRGGQVRISKRMVVVDSDALKKALPEYREMIGAKDATAAAFNHEESSFLAKRAVSRGLGERYDVLLDGTGEGGADKIAGKLAPARANGYRVRADYVTIQTEDAIERAAVRSVHTGRRVPETEIRRLHRDVSRDYRDALDRNLFDEARLWDNSILDNPILIMEKIDGKTKIYRQDLWDRFLAKANESITSPQALSKPIAPFPEINPMKRFDPGVEAQMSRLTVAYRDPALSEVEKTASRWYQGWHGSDANYSIRHKGVLSLDAGDLGHVRALDEAIAKSVLPEDMVLYRGVRRLKPKEVSRGFGDFRVGHEFTDDAYVSLTADREIASNFAGLEKGKGAVFRVRLPEGTKGLWYGQQEAEFLLGRGQKFRIVEVVDDVTIHGRRSVRLVTLEPIPSAPPSEVAAKVLKQPSVSVDTATEAELRRLPGFEEISAKETRKAVNGWNEISQQKIPVTQFFDDMFKGTGLKPKGLKIHGAGLDDLSPDARKMGFGAGFDYEAELVNKAGKRVGYIRRNMTRAPDGRLSVHHAQLVIDPEFQATGFGKRILRNQIGLYERLGLKEVELTASDKVGAYAWARFGFVPEVDAWTALKVELKLRLELIGENLSATTRLQLKAAISSSNPKRIWKIADMREKVPKYDGRATNLAGPAEEPIGSFMLRGAKWWGSLDLTDAAAVKRFKAYVGAI